MTRVGLRQRLGLHAHRDALGDGRERGLAEPGHQPGQPHEQDFERTLAAGGCLGDALELEQGLRRHIMCVVHDQHRHPAAGGAVGERLDQPLHQRWRARLRARRAAERAEQRGEQRVGRSVGRGERPRRDPGCHPAHGLARQRALSRSGIPAQHHERLAGAQATAHPLQRLQRGGRGDERRHGPAFEVGCFGGHACGIPGARVWRDPPHERASADLSLGYRRTGRIHSAWNGSRAGAEGLPGGCGPASAAHPLARGKNARGAGTRYAWRLAA